MYRANVKILKPGFEREMNFEFPQTIARDEILQKVFSTNKGYKDGLKSHPEDVIYPDVYVTWIDLEAKERAVSSRKPEVSTDDAKPIGTPSESLEKVQVAQPVDNSEVKETPAG